MYNIRLIRDDEHFEFKADEAKEIIESINTVVGL